MTAFYISLYLTLQLCPLTVKAGVTAVAAHTSFLQIPHHCMKVQTPDFLILREQGNHVEEQAWEGQELMHRETTQWEDRPHSGSGYQSFSREILPPKIQKWNECGASVSGFSPISSTSHNIVNIKEEFPQLGYTKIWYIVLPHLLFRFYENRILLGIMLLNLCWWRQRGKEKANHKTTHSCNFLEARNESLFSLLWDTKLLPTISPDAIRKASILGVGPPRSLKVPNPH